ncbi:TfuA-related McrA-glycine thioamidation protein [Methanorbis rubei]|uniref:TfuA-like core domain-containing protein n=1 Tax=Methanorbis rubei TaxID=3028300 RepID=A0AAE4MIY2_9EURY|nr:hypothetical protein [Methanocorpusculaceae archaeon Cs1]
MPSAVVFIGPSLPPEEARTILSDAEYLPPAKRGDLTAAAASGAKVIVLIDGVFFQDRAVGHREILSAIRSGIKVVGSSSMGALRASEMDTLGMIGIGEIYRWYKDGKINADDEVGLVYDPETHTALSEPMVNIRASFAAAKEAAVISDEEEAELLRACKAIYYPDRTYRRVLRDAGIAEDTKSALALWLKTNAVDQKRHDAVECLKTVRGMV